MSDIELEVSETSAGRAAFKYFPKRKSMGRALKVPTSLVDQRFRTSVVINEYLFSGYIDLVTTTSPRATSR